MQYLILQYLHDCDECGTTVLHLQSVISLRDNTATSIPIKTAIVGIRPNRNKCDKAVFD